MTGETCPDDRSLRKLLSSDLAASCEKQLELHIDRCPACQQRLRQLADFGLAKPIADDPGVTTRGTIAGTPEYMSPEQAVSNPELAARSELFSLGALLYHAASGTSPFRASSAFATLRAVCRDHPRRLSELVPEVPRPFVNVVERLLQKQPAAR